jgi:N-acetylmuramoyl-L-alanine amidase
MEKDLGVDVVLTRTKDVYLTLDERNAVANAENADLFLSIHANASNNRKARGVETYHLNTADGVASQRAAARENGVPWSAAVPDLDFILADLTINFNSPYSARLASLIQGSMASGLKRKYSGVKDLGVHTALFYVLVGAKCPSALLEVSFLSNYTEEKRLKSPRYQKELANSVVKGVQKYIKEQENIALNY